MNHDYLIDATPRVARQLVRLAEVAAIDLDPTIRALAAQDLLAPADLLGLPVRLAERGRVAVQRLLDHDLRAVLVTDRRVAAATRDAVLAAAALARARPITLALEDRTGWVDAARRFKLTVGTDPDEDPDVLLVEPRELPSPAIATERRRAGLFVTDQGLIPGLDSAATAAVEFPRTILLVAVSAWDAAQGCLWFKTPEVAYAAAVLNGGAPHGPLINNPFTRRTVLQPRGFLRHHPRDLAFLYGVVTELVDGDAPPTD